MRKSLCIQFEDSLGSLELRVDCRSCARVIALEGPTGAGKSSLLKTIVGVRRPRTAVLSFGENTWQSAHSYSPACQRKLAWVPQSCLLLPHLDVLKNLTYAPGSDRSDALEIADQLQLSTLLHRSPRDLSGGEKQRVALGRALVARRELLLLDEPFVALDQQMRQLAIEVAKDWTQRCATTVVLVSHHAPEVSDWIEDRWTLQDGVVTS